MSGYTRNNNVMMEQKPLFGFGRNWLSYSEIIDESHVIQAEQSLGELLGKDALINKSFLDIGCGSGIFSIAAKRMGAKEVIGIDIDPASIEASQINAKRWLSDRQSLSFIEGSVLNEETMNDLGLYDFVYAWGSLHHTGSMYKAIELTAQRVKKGGCLILAIYNRHITSGIWRVIKRLYNAAPAIFQIIMLWSSMPVILLAKWIATRRHPFEMRRGMDFKHNLVDWLGGFPYEYAKVSTMMIYLKSLGFEIERVIPAQVPTGCNEYICRLATK